MCTINHGIISERARQTFDQNGSAHDDHDENGYDELESHGEVSLQGHERYVTLQVVVHEVVVVVRV